ncbi:hypothetical protein ONZ51_g2786 [Trametes cubensis]|uniref:Uncharacterized protein n=1 Tax=Trametes cubensis TaxID=1111947 RepID=A0AAD7XBS5_9APHY|nr:hypothetical protein ONZ51_g2786 [Trametes cubensis]
MALIPACIVFEEPLVFPAPAVDPESVAEDVLDVVDADVFEELFVPDVLVGLPMTETTLVRETVAEGTLPVVDRAAGGRHRRGEVRVLLVNHTELCTDIAIISVDGYYDAISW